MYPYASLYIYAYISLLIFFSLCIPLYTYLPIRATLIDSDTTHPSIPHIPIYLHLSLTSSPPYLNYILTPLPSLHLHLISLHLSSDFSANEGVMMLINLSPGRLGTLSYYIPVLLLDDEEGGDDDAEV
jgi:hypothetical protein